MASEKASRVAGNVFKDDPSDGFADDNIDHSDRRLLFHPALDVPLLEETDLRNEDGILEYHYPELQHIRHIRLLEYSIKSNCNDAKFHISEKSLEDVDGDFIAISYCWGGEKPTEYLQISPREYLKITKSVHTLLRHVVGVAGRLPVWIDAICINQANLEEKSAQVSMMGDIYAAAKCVVVWLGTGDLTPTDEAALWSYLTPFCNQESTTFSGTNGFGGVGDMLFGRVLQSPWFERAWVVQEVCFARKVFFLCGAIGMTMTFLKDYLKIRLNNYTSLPQSYSVPSGWGRATLPVFERLPNLYGHRELIQRNGGRPKVPLNDILLEFQSLKATEPRDKVFAFLGLTAHPSVQTDYTNSIGDVFTEAMIACSPDLYDYRILGYAGLANPRVSGPTAKLAMVPTWVPDFSCTFFTPPFTLHQRFMATPSGDYAEAVIESITRKPRLIVRGPSGGYCLSLKMALIDTIEEMSMPGLGSVESPSSGSQEVFERQCDIMRAGIEMLTRRNRYPVSRPTSTICYETMKTGYVSRDDVSEEMKADTIKAFQESKSAREFFVQSMKDKKINPFSAEMHRSGIGRSRRLFTTQNGYIGAANNDIRKGDRVCLISRAPVPFILRGPVANFGPLAIYNLVCDAYVDGIMYGEASDEFSNQFKTVLLE